MKTHALRLYGKNDLRLERFELPEIQENEILADITTNSICMSSHKATVQGEDHKRVPEDIAQKPVIIGHEFCGTIRKVGSAHTGLIEEGTKFSVQPALNHPDHLLYAPGYSFHTLGGQATRVIIPNEVMEMNCLLPYHGDAFFKASLSEPVSCIIGAFNAQYHFKQGEYVHHMGIVENGTMALLAGAGPMGLGAIDYALHGPRRPRRLIVTDIDQPRLDRASMIFPPSHARDCGVELRYLNTNSDDPVAQLWGVNEQQGYDDVFVFAPVEPLVKQASMILGFNGCLNFFAGPSHQDFYAPINFYDVHYSGHHVVGTSGGNTDDMKDALRLMADDVIDPAVMITHVGGLDSAADTIKNLPDIPGGKKLIYTTVSLPLVALDDLERLSETGPFYRGLYDIVRANKNLWSTEAEEYVLANAPSIDTVA
jgi:threonine dehydrogenase-like Zn-dependent dehydrogenase